MSASSDIKTILQDPDYYAEAFSAFARLSSRYQVLATWADTIFLKKVVERLNVELTETDGKLRVLGVGSGTGEMDCKMLELLLVKYPNISNTVLEPSLKHITEYKALASSKGFTGVEWDWRQQTWDQYHQGLEKRGSGAERMHFISAIHSLYYVDNLETTILNLFDKLREGGILLLILISDKSGIYRLWEHFPVLSDCLHRRQLSSKHVQDVLIKHKIDFEAITQVSHVDITCCFQEGHKDGPLITDFIAHTVNLQETVPSKLVDEVMKYMGGSDCSVRKGEQLLLNNDWEAFIVKK